MTPADHASMRFFCPRCLVHLKAPPEAVGARCLCPRCHLFFEVPRERGRTTAVEEYPLRKEGEPRPAEQTVYVLVVCSVCHTRMYGTVDQVGGTLECPDCGTPAVVPPPPPGATSAKRPPRSAEEIGEYRLADEVDRAAGGVPAAEQSYVAVLCPVCNTRMHATLDQVGGRLECPDCGSQAVVPPPPPKEKKIDPTAGGGEDYRLADRQETIRGETARRPGAPPGAPGKRPGRSFDRRPILPRRPLLVGTFSFPFSAGARNYALLLAAVGAISLYLTLAGLRLVATPTPQTWLGSAFCIASAAMLAIAWFLLASACAMAVVRDTANGSDEVRDWPGAVFLDWFGEVFYLFNGLCVSVLPGAGLAWLLAGYDFSGLPAASIIAFLLFPIVLLSMLEQNSALGVISPSTWGTLRKDSGAWATFYLFSAVLLLAVGVVERVVFFLGGFLGSIVLALSLTVVWLIYFRLLGRLAWHCADRAAREEIEAELEEDEEIEEDDAETFSGGETWPAG